MITRRAALLGIGAALAAPAVVRAESLMKIVMPKPKIVVPLTSYRYSPTMGFYAVEDGRVSAIFLTPPDLMTAIKAEAQLRAGGNGYMASLYAAAIAHGVIPA